MDLFGTSAAPGQDTWGQPLEPNEERRTLFCGRCGVNRVFCRRKVRHRLHFLISIGTLGLWLPAWGVVILVQRLRPWICSECGTRQRANARARRRVAIAHEE